MKILFSLFATCLFVQVFAQNSDKITVSTHLIDSKTKKAIAFASIYHPKTNNGTLSNINGYFRFSGLQANDTLIISYVGYGKLVFAAENLGDTLELTTKTENLNEAYILSDYTFLYKLFNKSKRTKSYDEIIAKTYFELETFVEGKQVELLECYFNGNVKGYDVNGLTLKNGRIALSKSNGQIFVSLATSKVLNMHSLHEYNEYFPTSPFELNISRLKKEYDLRLINKLTEKEATYFVISFSPKKYARNYFEGEAWIDSITGNVLKTKYRVKDAKEYPFLPIKETDSILSVDMEITKNFELRNGKMLLKSVDFKYDIDYKNTNGHRYDVSTFAVLHVYDYTKSFITPTFVVHDFVGDYLRIQSAPYNDFFWENMDEFRFNDRANKNEIFRRVYANIDFRALKELDKRDQTNYFNPIYMPWSERRFQAGDRIFGEKYNLQTSSEAWQRMHFASQLYMDINQFKDSTHVLTQVIYDPLKSFYSFDITDKFFPFFNIYMDLLELERRKFMNQLSKAKTLDPDELLRLHASQLEKNELVLKKYLRDTEYGNNLDGILSYNKLIDVELDIENIIEKIIRINSDGDR